MKLKREYIIFFFEGKREYINCLSHKKALLKKYKFIDELK